MADVAVVVDGTCYLPRALIDSLDITVVSGYYDLGDGPRPESEFDGDLAGFYAKLDAAKTVAKTSPPTVEDFVAVFERLLARHGAVVSVLISNGLSETCSIAREAAARLESEARDGERLAVIDSAASGGLLGLQAMAAARAAAAGEDRAGVVDSTRRARQEGREWGLVDTLEYLRRSGRVGSARAWIGSVLDLKPILTMESETTAVERVRTRRRGIERLVELMQQRRAAVGADRWFVHHTSSNEEAQRLADRLEAMFGTTPEFVCELGPIAATNLGPGALVVGSIPESALGGERG